MDAGRLFHNVFAREAVAARREYGDQCLRNRIARDVIAVGETPDVLYFFIQASQSLYSGVLPLRIGGLL